MGRANAPGLVEVEDNNILFIFDLNSITSRQHLEDELLCLAVFTELVNTFKDIGVDGYMFKYVADESLIISDSKALTISYMNSLKEKVKAEYRPLNIEEVYTFTCPIRHIDIVNSEAVFLDKYNVTSDLLCSTTVDYEGKTITIKSKCKSVKRTIPYFVANLIESCIYIPDYINKMQFNDSTKPIKYPYRELIKDLYTTDFIKRSVPISLPREDEVKVDYADVYANRNKYYHPSPEDKVVASSIETIAKEDFSKVEDDRYTEIIDSITDEDINKFINELEPATNKMYSINSSQAEVALKVAEAMTKKNTNSYNISDYDLCFTDTLYSRQDV